jgi:NAD(P)-dependent dehydrogenase (short-subunit alcohol dehydrogenase family)
MRLKGIPLEIRKQLIDAIPAKRFGTVEEVADAAYFLATNTYANNCVLNLDGGLSAT